jgi:hypothetical protein
MSAARTALIAVEILVASVWVGSLVCLALVSNAARHTLDPTSRVALFRRVGRVYGVVGSGSLFVGICGGAALAWPPSQFGGTVTAALGLSVVIGGITIVGMLQARRMTKLRLRVIQSPNDPNAVAELRRRAALAGAVRGTMAALTLVVVVLGANVLNR